MSSRKWQHRISDILECIAKIESYVQGMNYEAFSRDSRTIDAVIRNFITIG